MFDKWVGINHKKPGPFFDAIDSTKTNAHSMLCHEVNKIVSDSSSKARFNKKYFYWLFGNATCVTISYGNWNSSYILNVTDHWSTQKLCRIIIRWSIAYSVLKFLKDVAFGFFSSFNQVFIGVKLIFPFFSIKFKSHMSHFVTCYNLWGIAHEYH